MVKTPIDLSFSGPGRVGLKEDSEGLCLHIVPRRSQTKFWPFKKRRAAMMVVEGVIFPGMKSYPVTPRKINIEPENDGLEDNFPFPAVYSQVPC